MAEQSPVNRPEVSSPQPIDPPAVRAQLDRILDHPLFSQAHRQARFLTFVVLAELDGRGHQVSQYAIAVEVFDREPTFDPLDDSIVRVEARRLRAKLTEYYAGPGREDPVVIRVPKGAYRATLQGAPRRPTEAGDDDIATIAVMPFDNFSDTTDDDYFSDGIAEDIITDLSKISTLHVVSRHSTFAYKGDWSRARDIHEDLGARYVLAGSVRKAGQRIRITAQLVDGATERQIWSGRYDRELADIFAIQDEVSKHITEALKLRLTPVETRRLGRPGTDNLEAHDLFLRGRDQFYRFVPEGLRAADELLTRAVEVDPSYAEAHAWRSRCLTILLLTGLEASEDRTLVPALAAARRAVELDPLLPLAHAKLGWALMWNRQIEDALASTERAVALSPSSSEALLWRSLVLSSAGQGDEGLEAVQTSMRLDPYFTVTHLMAAGLAHFASSRYPQSLNYVERAIRRNPSFVFGHLIRGAILGAMDRKDEARTATDALRTRADAKRVRERAFFFNAPQAFRRFDDGLDKAGLPRSTVVDGLGTASPGS